MFTQEEVYTMTLLIYRSIEVLPLASHFDICFLYSPRCANWHGEVIPLLLKFGNVRLDPSQDGCVRELDTACSHHSAQVTVAELVGDIASQAENDY